MLLRSLGLLKKSFKFKTCFRFELTDSSTTDEVSGYEIKSDIVEMATISHDLYGRDIDGFDKLGEGNAFTHVRRVYQLIHSD